LNDRLLGRVHTTLRQRQVAFSHSPDCNVEWNARQTEGLILPSSRLHANRADRAARTMSWPQWGRNAALSRSFGRGRDDHYWSPPAQSRTSAFTHTGRWNPPFQDWGKLLPLLPRALAATNQNVPPQSVYASSEGAQLVDVAGNCVVLVVT
jgi:hypothetical protein